MQKIGFAYSTPLPLNLEGWGFSFASFSCIIDIGISYKKSLPTIMKKSNILFIPDLPRWKISKK